MFFHQEYASVTERTALWRQKHGNGNKVLFDSFSSKKKN